MSNELSFPQVPGSMRRMCREAPHLQRLDAQHGQQLSKLLLQVLCQGAGGLAILCLHPGVKDVQGLGLGLSKVLLHLAHLHRKRTALHALQDLPATRGAHIPCRNTVSFLLLIQVSLAMTEMLT